MAARYRCANGIAVAHNVSGATQNTFYGGQNLFAMVSIAPTQRPSKFRQDETIDERWSVAGQAVYQGTCNRRVHPIIIRRRANKNICVKANHAASDFDRAR